MFEAVTKSGDALTAHNTLPPVGVVMWLSGNTVPDGCLAANGAAVSRTTYAELFAAIGTEWGAGDGSTTFNVPDARGRVPEGAQTAGGYNAPGLPNIVGGGDMFISFHFQKTSATPTNQGNGAMFLEKAANNEYTVPTGWQEDVSGRRPFHLYFNANRNNSIYGASTTVQPASVKLLPVIVYRSKRAVTNGGGGV